MKIIALIILLTTGLISFNASALVTVDNFTYTPAQCAARPPLLDVSMLSYWDAPDGQTYAYYDGCEYMAHGLGVVIPDGYFSSWYPTGRVKPGSGSGSSGGGSTGGSSGGSSGSGGSGGSSGSTPVTGGTGGTGWDSGSTGGSSGGSSGSGSTGGGLSGTPLNFNYGGSTGSTGRPGETVHTFPSPPFIYTPPGEVSEREVLNYMKDFFIYNKECGSSCINYFNKNNPLPKPLSCEDLAFNLNVPHKKPDCRSDDIAWYDKDGRFIQFKYGLTDKAHHDFINKLKGDFGLGGGDGSFNTRLSPSHNLDPVYTNRLGLQFYNNKTPYDIMSYNNMSLTNIDKGIFLNGLLLRGILSELQQLHQDSNDFNYKLLSRPSTGNNNSYPVPAGSGYGDGVLSELQQFHHDSNDYNSKLLDRLNTDNLDSEAKDSVSKLSVNITGLLNGENVGGEFAEASRLMGQIGNGADSPLLGKFLEKNIIPIVDTHQCVMPVFGRGTDWEFTLSSDKWLKLKQILTFMMYAYTFWCLFEMLTNTGDRK